MMRHQAAIHSNPPVTIPTRYPSPARPTTCSAEILEANSDMPINGHRRSRPAKKYSASVCFLPAARRTAPTTSARLMTMMTESRMPNTHGTPFRQRVRVPSNSIRSAGRREWTRLHRVLSPHTSSSQRKGVQRCCMQLETEAHWPARGGFPYRFAPGDGRVMERAGGWQALARYPLALQDLRHHRPARRIRADAQGRSLPGHRPREQPARRGRLHTREAIRAQARQVQEAVPPVGMLAVVAAIVKPQLAVVRNRVGGGVDAAAVHRSQGAAWDQRAAGQDALPTHGIPAPRQFAVHRVVV